MNATISRIEGKFPEPEFGQLQREVFSHLQLESPALASVLRREAEVASSTVEEPLKPNQMVRFGAYAGAHLIGWSCGWFERGKTFYMANSGVHPSHQGRGVYSTLLEEILHFAAAHGVVAVRSQHSVLNNAIIIRKLKRGFQVSGLNFSAQMGSLVELTLHLSESRSQLFKERSIPLVPPQ